MFQAARQGGLTSLARCDRVHDKFLMLDVALIGGGAWIRAELSGLSNRRCHQISLGSSEWYSVMGTSHRPPVCETGALRLS